MQRSHILVSCLAIAVVVAGCNEQPMDPTAESRAAQSTALPFGIQPAHLRLSPSARLTDQYFVHGIGRVIDPDDYSCSSTPLRDLYDGEVAKFSRQEPEIFDLFYNRLLADLIPSIDALFFQTEQTPQYFGYQGEYTQVMLKTEKDARRFWDIFSDDIQLIGAHGTMLLDVDRVAAAYEAGFTDGEGNPLSPELARTLASLVRDAMLESETLNGGNHPILSFNAFAISTDGGPIPDKIVMGDGILAGFEALGFEDVAPQAIYGHEFAHHIQFENDYFADHVPGATTRAELSRYWELMADAMSAYFLTHKRGAALNRKRVEQFLQLFFNVGGCEFTDPTHHGTPNQRMAAARLGFNLADQAQKQGHILSSEQFHDLFVEAYPDLIAPDAA